MKQIIKLNIKKIKEPNRREVNQLAIYKRGQGVELGTTEKQIQPVVGAGLELGTSALRVQRANHSATLPPTASAGSVENMTTEGLGT